MIILRNKVFSDLQEEERIYVTSLINPEPRELGLGVYEYLKKKKDGLKGISKQEFEKGFEIIDDVYGVYSVEPKKDTKISKIWPDTYWDLEWIRGKWIVIRENK